jgi:hypothetical protein
MRKRAGFAFEAEGRGRGELFPQKNIKKQFGRETFRCHAVDAMLDSWKVLTYTNEENYTFLRSIHKNNLIV